MVRVNNIFLSIILPAHNEAQRLPQSLDKIQKFVQQYLPDCEVLVIENASTDGTYEIVQAHQAAFPQLRCLHLDQAGKGNAIREGMLAARGDYRFMADVDLSMPIEEILNFLPPRLADPQVAIGSREKKGSKRIGEPFYRHLIGRVFNFLVRLLVLPGVQDTQCGFKCFSADAAEKIFRLQTLEGWSFDVELLTIAQTLGFRVEEVPITWHYKPGSQVRILQDSWRMFRELLLIRRNKQKGVYLVKTL